MNRISTIHYESCRLCFRACGVDRLSGNIGYCGESAAMRVGRIMLHFWEEPCISGRRGSGAVFFSGCSLGCVYCQNRELAKGGLGKIRTPQELAERFLRLEQAGAHNINLVTASHFAPGAAEAIMLSRAAGLKLPIVFNCAGCEPIDTLRLLDGLIDVYLTDFKYFSRKPAEAYSNCPDYFDRAKAALNEMYRQCGTFLLDAEGIAQKGVLVRHLVLPGYSSDAQRIVRYLWESYGARIRLSLMNQFTPFGLESYPELNRTLSRREYDRVVNEAIRLGMEEVYIQEWGTASESFIPEFDGSEM